MEVSTQYDNHERCYTMQHFSYKHYRREVSTEKFVYANAVLLMVHLNSSALRA